MERGAREHETVEQRDGYARIDAALERAEHAAGGGAVEVQRVAFAPVNGGNHDRRAVDDEADVADQRLVEDGVHGFGVVAAALGEAAHAGAVGCGNGCGHGVILSSGSSHQACGMCLKPTCG